MARLSYLTPSAVTAGIGEFIDLGQDAFLSKYGFSASRDYFLVHDDLLIDTKPLIAAAFQVRHPDLPPLTPNAWRDDRPHPSCSPTCWASWRQSNDARVLGTSDGYRGNILATLVTEKALDSGRFPTNVATALNFEGNRL